VDSLRALADSAFGNMTMQPTTTFSVRRITTGAARLAVALAAGTLFFTVPMHAARAADAASETLTLERIYPEKSFFGPSARSMAYSRDGRFLAFLYVPYLERRHGADLYLFDTKSGETRRITSVGRLAEFEAEVRKVRDDRAAKAKKAGVSLTSLAAEQRERHAAVPGWLDNSVDGWVVGRWKGSASASAEGTSLPTGDVELSLVENADGVLTGELRIGLARLSVREGRFDRETRIGTGVVRDAALGIDATLDLTLASAAAGGATGPSLTATLTAVAKDEAASKEEAATDQPKKLAGSIAMNLARSAPEPVAAKDRVPEGIRGAIGERLTLGDVVLADDAEINDEKDGKPPKDPAPRYGGVQSFEWLPKRSGTDTSAEDAARAEMLVLIDGDVYRLTIDLAMWDRPAGERWARPAAEDGSTPPPADVDATANAATGDDAPKDAQDAGDDEDAKDAKAKDATDATDAKAKDAKDAKAKPAPSAPIVPYLGDLVRLTRTRERESDVQYLPDGSGYTYLRDGALMRVSFGDHRIVQLDPELKDGERMVGYRVSPDQRRLVFLANRGPSGPAAGSGRTVTIVNYRDRFARAVEVPRHMPDDPWPESYASIYLYDLGKHDTEEGALERVFTKRSTGPRDVMRVPEWSPDSSRIAFAAFEQSTGMVKILEAGFKPKEDPAAKAKDDAGSPAAAGAKEAANDTAKDQAKDQVKKDDGDAAKNEPEFSIENARVVYEFAHTGGPNTPGMIAPLYLSDSRRMAFITELSGFRHLHLLDPRYEQLTQLTSGRTEVYPFQQSTDAKTLWYSSSPDDPAQEHLFAIDLETGVARRLTQGEGVYSRGAVRDDGTGFAAMHVDFNALPELLIASGIDPKGAAGDGGGAQGTDTERRLTDSHPPEAHALTKVAPEYFAFENRHGQTIHGHMFKPKGWTKDDKRPLLLYVYGGPLGERNMAARGSFDGSSYFFARYMAEKHGWLTATIDPRGASGYGAVFEKASFEQVGKPQTEDLVDGARWLVKNAGVDEKRMALHGWSFGGFQTQMVLYTEPDVFAAGIAGAGPTEWHNYNSWYSTGTIGRNAPGKVELEKYSLLPLAKNLKGKLLLVHGMEDSNVLYQDTVRVYRELLKAKKQNLVELFVDPTGGHGLGGDVKSFGRFSKYEDFLLRTIGPYVPPAPAAAAPAAGDAKDAPPPVPEGVKDAAQEAGKDAGQAAGQDAGGSAGTPRGDRGR
jgi:dipeptidyl aminopeptidase/acylaminoacyl peptidase